MKWILTPDMGYLMTRLSRASFAAMVVAAGAIAGAQQPPERADDAGRQGLAGVPVSNRRRARQRTATVTDASGRFVPGLTKDDFRVYDDDVAQPISHFSSERVPVSLGIVLDTSGSMSGEKIHAAREALDRFLFQLLDPQDEVFLYRFDNAPELVEGWTTDKQRISDSLGRIQPRGGTALYDTVAEAVRMAQQGRNRKKAVVIISDGNDTSSRSDVYSRQATDSRRPRFSSTPIGIDGPAEPMLVSNQYPPRAAAARDRFPCRFRCPAAGVRRRPRRSRRRGRAETIHGGDRRPTIA